MGYNIAIDGPAGAGKSTIAKLVAKELGFIYVDTGAMYRGLAVHFLKKGIVPGEVEKIEAACEDAKVELGYENGVQQVYLNGENITSQLREEAVGNMASVSSAVPAVRAKLLDLQRNLAKEKDVVMDGRDIGTNVLQNADVKVYLTASVECRAMRRFKELEGKGEACDFEQIRQDMQGIGMTGNLALPTLIAICSAALGKTPLNSLAILGEISIGGTLIKVDELASTLQVCLDSGAKKVLLPITSAGDLGTVPSDLVGAFSLIFYSSAEEAVFKALGVE